jgi:hypothetical protein
MAERIGGGVNWGIEGMVYWGEEYLRGELFLGEAFFPRPGEACFPLWAAQFL